MADRPLAAHAGRDSVAAGENVWVNVDVLMTHDVCGPGTIGIFHEKFGRNAKVWDRERVVIIPDHYIFTAYSKCNLNVDILRDFVKEQQLLYFYNEIDDPNGHWVFDHCQGALKRQYGSHYAGVCHTALHQKGHTRPGEVLFGTDSHTCMAGAFNEFATGIGNTDAGFVMGTGKLWLKVPPTMRFVFEGALPPYLMAKDLILAAIGEIGCDGATYKAMYFAGEGISSLTLEDRMTLTNMAIEAGGKNGVCDVDEKTLAYVRHRSNRPTWEVFRDDPDATYAYEAEWDLATMEPMVAKPHSPDNKAFVSQVKGTKLDRAYIGSCTGGKLTDFRAAAGVLNGKAVKIDTFVVPATVAPEAGEVMLTVGGVLSGGGQVKPGRHGSWALAKCCRERHSSWERGRSKRHAGPVRSTRSEETCWRG